MKTLWFKQEFVEPLLSGAKHSTYRQHLSGFAVGDLVSCSVGPRTPFMVVKITKITRQRMRQLAPELRERLRALYPEASAVYRLDFQEVEGGRTPDKADARCAHADCASD